MNDQPEQNPSDEPEQPEQQPAEQPQDSLDDLNAELANLLEKEQAKKSASKDPMGNPRLAVMELSHDEIHALGTSVKMLFQFCSMALIQGKNSPDEAKEWKDRLETLLGLKDGLIEQHKAVYDNEPCDDDDDECDHDH